MKKVFTLSFCCFNLVYNLLLNKNNFQTLKEYKITRNFWNTWNFDTTFFKILSENQLLSSVIFHVGFKVS